MYIEGVKVHFTVGRDNITLNCEKKEGRKIRVKAENKEYVLEDSLDIALT